MGGGIPNEKTLCTLDRPSSPTFVTAKNESLGLVLKVVGEPEKQRKGKEGSNL